MSGEEIKLELTVRYKDMEIKFSGTTDEVIRSFISFLNKILPAYEFASSLTLTVDLEDLLKSVTGIIAFTPEGPVVTVPREKLGERDAIIVHLIKTYIGFRTGRLEKDSLSITDILPLTKGKFGTVTGRLSEMTDLGLVQRVGRGEYRITTLGIKSFIEEILPKIKTEKE